MGHEMWTFSCETGVKDRVRKRAGYGHVSQWLRVAIDMRLAQEDGEEYRAIVKTGGGYVDNSTAEDLRIFAHVQVAKELSGALPADGGAVSMVQFQRKVWKDAKAPYIDFTDQEVRDLLEQERSKGEVKKPRKRNYGPPPDTDGFVAPGGE